MVFHPVSRDFIIDALAHIRELHRRVKPFDEREIRAYERREIVIKDLLSNLPRTHEHPTLKTVLEVAELCSLTLEGAHKLFGYDLEALRDFDLKLNSGRTHIFDNYAFNRDHLVDLPARLASHESFLKDASLRDLVLEWQRDTPMRAIDEKGWKKPGAFYVHVGTEDSLGSSLPPGSMALVEPIGDAERARPDPRSTYLLQFANGYRCSSCVVSQGNLRLLRWTRGYPGRPEFEYPGAVRIAGRVRMFAVTLPVPEYPRLQPLADSRHGADLILPWEHATRDRLLATKLRRFQRSREEKARVEESLINTLHAKLSRRSERRYRSDSSSAPHVNVLLHLTVAHFARYTDALRTGGSWLSDDGRFSLSTLLNANSLEEAWNAEGSAHLPTPIDVWEARQREFGEWPSLLSIKFPHLQLWDDRVVRLAQGSAVQGLDPTINPGSWLLLDKVTSVPDTQADRRRAGWSRSIYLLRRGVEMICGYLEREGDQWAILKDESNGSREVFHFDDLTQLHRVSGIAVPV